MTTKKVQGPPEKFTDIQKVHRPPETFRVLALSMGYVYTTVRKRNLIMPSSWKHIICHRAAPTGNVCWTFLSFDPHTDKHVGFATTAKVE